MKIKCKQKITARTRQLQHYSKTQESQNIEPQYTPFQTPTVNWNSRITLEIAKTYSKEIRSIKIKLNWRRDRRERSTIRSNDGGDWSSSKSISKNGKMKKKKERRVLNWWKRKFRAKVRLIEYGVLNLKGACCSSRKNSPSEIYTFGPLYFSILFFGPTIFVEIKIVPENLLRPAPD